MKRVRARNWNFIKKNNIYLIKSIMHYIIKGYYINYLLHYLLVFVQNKILY